MQAAHSVVLQVIDSGSLTSVTISAIARRPPRRSSRAASANTFGLSGERLMTPLLMTRSADSAGSGTSAGTIPVVVAARDIGIRVQILPADVTIAQFHESDVPPGSFAKVTDLKSVVAAVNITKGQPVTNNLLLGVGGTVIGPQSAFLPIPPGYVALTIPTGEQQGVGGYIQVGDYLSMVVQLNGKTGKNVRTVYTNIPVIRVGAAPADTTPVQGGTTIPPKQGVETTTKGLDRAAFRPAIRPWAAASS